MYFIFYIIILQIIKTKIEQICAKTPEAMKGKAFNPKISDKNANSNGITMSQQSGKGNIINKKTIEANPPPPPIQQQQHQEKPSENVKPPSKPPIAPSKDKDTLKMEADQFNPHSSIFSFNLIILETTDIAKIDHRRSDPNIPESKTCHLL